MTKKTAGGCQKGLHRKEAPGRCQECRREYKRKWRAAHARRPIQAPGSRRRFCPRGHDTWTVGRTKDGRCRTCRSLAEKQRYRRLRAEGYPYRVASQRSAAGYAKAMARNARWRRDHAERARELARAARERNKARYGGNPYQNVKARARWLAAKAGRKIDSD